MKLSTGRVAFEIEFDNGEVGTIYFNPTDPQLAVRIKDCGNAIEAELSKIASTDVNVDGSAKSMDDVDAIRECNECLLTEIDKAFDSKVSDVVFRYCSPLAIVNGNFFILSFLDAISPEIMGMIEKTKTTFDKTMDDRLAKYSK